jgi:hypothetical protein
VGEATLTPEPVFNSLCNDRLLAGLTLLLLFLMLLPFNAVAEEGGSGHYFPGSMSSFMDGVSATEVFISRLNVIDYDGSFGARREVPIAGLTVLDVDVDLRAYGLTFFWRPSWGGLSEKWSYGMSTTIPFVDLTVSGSVRADEGEIQRIDNDSGLGDVFLIPVMFNYHHSADLNASFRVGFYAPTGSYQAGQLANTGKNFWTIEPTASLIYFGLKNGREASVFLGVDINKKNSATNYKSGTQAHIEGTLAQHLPLWGGLAGFGITGFWYHQLSGDSGVGANLGSFKARANGIGPTISFNKKLSEKYLLIGEFKWLHEFSNKRRPEGNTLFLKVMLAH